MPSPPDTPAINADLCVFIGRFQPLHAGHVRVLEQGLSQASHLLVLVGSAGEPRTLHNPFTATERAGLLRESVRRSPRLHVRALEDSAGDPGDWVARAHGAVEQAWREIRARDPARPVHPRVALIGHAKDASSYYLGLFPQWASIDVPLLHPLSATDVRAALFGDFQALRPRMEALVDRHARQAPPGDPVAAVREANARVDAAFSGTARSWVEQGAREFLAGQRARGFPDVPPCVAQFLEGFMATPDYAALVQEAVAAARVRWQWRHAPYPPKHVTADAAVFHEGHVLMVQRQGHPGRGLWALPGGFVEDDEPVREAAVRELGEETGLDVPRTALLASQSAQAVFDAPLRSSRGRTITHAFGFVLPPGPRPATRAPEPGDQETRALAWVPLSGLRREACFEDHFTIIRRLARQAGV